MVEVLLVSVALLVAGLVKYGDALLRVTRGEQWIGDMLLGVLFMGLAGLTPLLELPPLRVIAFVIVFLPIYVLVSRLTGEFQVEQVQRTHSPTTRRRTTSRMPRVNFDLDFGLEYHVLDVLAVALLLVIAVFTILTVIQLG